MTSKCVPHQYNQKEERCADAADRKNCQTKKKVNMEDETADGSQPLFG